MKRIASSAALLSTLLIVSQGVCRAQSVSAGVPAPPGSTERPSPASGTPSSGVMQLKRQVTGDLTYHFLAVEGVAKAASVTAPIALPAAAGTNNLVVLPVPASAGKHGILEILDNTRGNLARLPVTTSGVVALTESSFSAAQRINVPVQAKGLPVTGAQVTITNASKNYSQTTLLQPDDNGVARFDGVPLNEPVTVTVSYGANPPESETKTLSASRGAAAWPPIAVTWPDARTIAPPPAAAASPSHETGAGKSSEDDGRATRPQDASPLNSIVSTLVSLALLAGLGYGLFWAYQNGHVHSLMKKYGIEIANAPASASAPAADPFARPERTPLQPITEGTADVMGVGSSMPGAVTSTASNGPKLIATAGTYAGNIFPLNGTADIGRDTTNAVPLPNDTNASRRHATIQNSGGQYVLTDNGSSNGTFVNGVRIQDQTPHPLRAGDEVQIGMTRFRFEA